MALPACFVTSLTGRSVSDFPVWAVVRHQGQAGMAVLQQRGPAQDGDRDLSPTLLPWTASSRGSTQTWPRPHPLLAAPPHTSFVSTVPSGSGALQGRHLLPVGIPAQLCQAGHLTI